MSFLPYFSRTVENPNSPKYLVMIILFLGVVAYAIYSAVSFDPHDELCAYLVLEEKRLQKESAVKDLEGYDAVIFPEISRQYDKEYDGENCDQRLSEIKRKSEESVLYRLLLRGHVRRWVKVNR